MLAIGGILEHSNSKHETTLHDARNVMYAAYHDDAKSVRQLLDYGLGKNRCGALPCVRACVHTVAGWLVCW